MSATVPQLHPSVLGNRPSSPCTDQPWPSLGRSFSLVALAFCSLSVLGSAIHASFHRQVDVKACTMTYMQPTYYRLLAFDANQTQYADKYGLLFYRDEHDAHPRLAQSDVHHIGDRDWAIEKEAKVCSDCLFQEMNTESTISYPSGVISVASYRGPCPFYPRECWKRPTGAIRREGGVDILSPNCPSGTRNQRQGIAASRLFHRYDRHPTCN